MMITLFLVLLSFCVLCCMMANNQIYNQSKLMQKNYILTEADQGKISSLVVSFAKSEPNILKYSEAMSLMLDRCIFNTKFTLAHFHRLFESATLVKPAPPEGKREVQGERTINKEQLIFLFNEAAKLLYRPNPNYKERFFQTFLSEKIQSDNGEINRARVMVLDDLSKKLLVEETVEKLVEFQDQIKSIFIAYTIENYWSIKRKRRLLLEFREMLLQNKKWSYLSLVLFMRESQLTPVLLNIEHIEELCRNYIPSINNKQQQFYSRHTLSDAYNKNIDGSDGTLHSGDPGIMLFELELLFVRMAYDSYPKDLERKNLGEVVARFFKYLLMRKNEDIQRVELPDINRKMVKMMKEYYRVTTKQLNDVSTEKKQEEPQKVPYEVMAQKQTTEIDNLPSLGLDFQQIVKNLEKELPKLPQTPRVEAEDKGPYNKNNAVTIGQQPPPQPSDKDGKGGGKAEKKEKSAEQPERVFKWENYPQPKLVGEDYLKEIHSKLEFEVKPLGDISRGLISKEGYPSIIGEVLFPPELPKSVVPFLQDATNAMAGRNFYHAIEDYNKAISAWKKTNVDFENVAELFFEYCKGNVYLSCGKLEYAFNQFYNCRKFDTSRMPFSNPDRSLPFYGMGEVFFEMQQYQLAGRCFLKARQIRESVLGLEHVQTATVFNNLACCYFMVGRNQQALGYIQIAEVIIDTELGAHHERTMTCRSNFKKISRGSLEHEPTYRKMWEVFEEDKFQKKKKKKTADDKKKK